MEPHYRIGVAAVLQRTLSSEYEFSELGSDTQILLLKRKGSHGAGTWGLPGGHMDLGETPAQTASREVEEEMGLVIPPESFWPTTFTADVFEVEDKRYITLYMKVAVEPDCSPCIMEPDKCDGFEWVTPPEWPGELFLPLQNLLQQGGDLPF